MYRTKDQVALEFIAEGRRRGITARGIIMCIACGLVESELTVYSNPAVPESMKLPHDKVGYDSRSVGPLQQQVVMGNGWWWGDAKTCMDPTTSSGLFYARLVKYDYDDHPDPGAVIQDIQDSSFPDRYAKRMADATAIYNRLSKEGVPMPITGDPTWLLDELLRAGLPAEGYGDWKNEGHGDFGVITHIMAHHTGGNSSPNAIQNSPSLGVCSQIFLRRDGRIFVVAAGIAWHAGQGSYPGIPRDDANRVSIGVEAENNGTEGWGPAQYWSYVGLCAVILNKLGLGADRVIGHKEWAGASQGKWDPGGMDMNKFRADIAMKQRELRGGPAPAPVENQINRIYGFSPWLGKRLDPREFDTRVIKGKVANFANGNIYWRADANRTIPVPLNIMRVYANYDFEAGFLGMPLKYHAVIFDKPGEPDAVAIGDAQGFEGGAIYAKYGQPGFAVHGKIGERWFNKEQAEKGHLGWPISDEYKIGDEVAQDFEHGTIVFDPDGTFLVKRGEPFIPAPR